jgi:hypothetical protein
MLEDGDFPFMQLNDADLVRRDPLYVLHRIFIQYRVIHMNMVE